MSRTLKAGMKQVEVSILGQSYVLVCPEGGEALLTTAVASVDREMSAIRDAGKVKARERIAVLAALNLAYQLAHHQAERPAERPTDRQAELPAERAPAPAAAASSAVPAEAPLPADVDIDALMQRIDRALGGDDRLL
jgi:cell division protein ZapA